MLWKESRGAADWVIVTVVDEHLYHPHLPAYLKWAKRKSITVIPGLGYEMVSVEFPACEIISVDDRPYGAVHGAVSKLSLFDPDAIEETNFAPGRHQATPRGQGALSQARRGVELAFQVARRRLCAAAATDYSDKASAQSIATINGGTNTISPMKRFAIAYRTCTRLRSTSGL